MTRARQQAATRREPPELATDDALAARLFEELERRTAGTAGVTRASYGAGEALAHEMVRREGLRLGLRVETDAALNLYLTLPACGRDRASSSDRTSIPCRAAAISTAPRRSGRSRRRRGAGPGRRDATPDLTIMAIRAEESVWFNASYIGSRAAFGLLQPDELDHVVRSDDGLSSRLT